MNIERSTSAIQHIRPVEIEELTSMRYWEKWNRVTEQAQYRHHPDVSIAL